MNQSHTGAIVEEHKVDGAATNDVCQKISDTRFIINGKEICLPVKVGAASMLMNTYVVDAQKVAHILEGTGFRPLTLWPGKALMQLLAVDYRENDLGDYNEGAIIFPVLTPDEPCLPLIGPWIKLARGTACNYVYRMPVNQGFTTHAGRFIWGFPKWKTGMEIEYTAAKYSGCFSDNGMLVYRIHSDAGGDLTFKQQRSPSVTVRNGLAGKTWGTSSASGMTFRLGGEIPTIGNEHPLAIELRSLGLPKKPLFSVSAKELKMHFDGAETVAIGERFHT